MLHILFGRAHFCGLLGFTKREGFLDWLRPCQVFKTPFSCIELVLLAMFLTSSVPVVMYIYRVLKFVSRRAQDPDFSATRVCCVYNVPTHAREMQWCQESGRWSSHVKMNVWHRAHTLDKHYRGAFKQCCQRLSILYF